MVWELDFLQTLTRDFVGSDLVPIVNVMNTQFVEWSKLHLSWFGQISVFKMKICQNLCLFSKM